MKISQLVFKSNPLKIVLDSLSTEPEPVTMQMLDWIDTVLEDFDYTCETYSDVLDFLEFMESHKLIELVKGPSGTYTIKKVGYYA